MRSRRIFTSLNSSKHVPIAKTRSHRFWSEYNLSKHVPVAKYWFVSFLIAWIISVIVWCYVLVFIRGSQVSKRAENDQEIAFYVMKKKSLWKPRSHRFWHDYNSSKHVPVAFATFLRRERVLTNWKCRKYWKIVSENTFSSQKRHKKAPK